MIKDTIRSILIALVIVILIYPQTVSADSSLTKIPIWLQKHVGLNDGKIAPIILERARDLYQKKKRQGLVNNPCYLAMDATKPSSSINGNPAPRFYVICEKTRSFSTVSSGYGNGRKLKNNNFSNGRQCAKNFSNAEGSKLTAGGSYTTAETRTSFKGFYTQSGHKIPFFRTFLLFDGEGETSNARERAIGGHPAIFLKWKCRFKNKDSPHADDDGYVPYGNLVNYTGGRSNGCTTWSIPDSKKILKIVKEKPTTLYIYPESKDIDAIRKAINKGIPLRNAGLYWNKKCLTAIGSPKFWPKETLQPIINQWRQSLPSQTPLVLPICN